MEDKVISELCEYSKAWNNMIDVSKESETVGDIVYFVLKDNPDIKVSNTQDRYVPNHLHTVRVKNGKIEFMRDWQENKDFSSLEELLSLERNFIKDCVKKLR